jgi:hypothetical protein
MGDGKKGFWMSDGLFIMLQAALAFGAPLTLAFIELYKLRRRTPAPVGGGEPTVVAFTPRPRQPTALPPAAAGSDADAEVPLKRAA